MDYSMNSLGISIEDINEMMKEIEVQTSLIRKKPVEILENTDIMSRQMQLRNFEVLNKIYVLPLKEMADRISMKLYGKRANFYGLEDMSIMGRMMAIRNFLLSVGCKMNDIIQLIPQDEEEVNILFRAYKKGFSLEFTANQSLMNGDRLIKAMNYLKQENINQEDSSRRMQ